MSSELPVIFLTGGTGFVGSHFINEALDRGHRVVAMRRHGSRPRISLKREPEWLDDELGSGKHHNVLRDCEVFVHLAAAGVTPDTESWDNCFRWNVDASLREWIHADEAGVKRFVICGTCSEYGRSGERYDFIPTDAPLEPIGPYHASKAAATMAAYGLTVERKLQTTIARLFHVYGEGEAAGRLWPMIKEAVRTGADLPLTRGEQVRDFTPVNLVVSELLSDCTRRDLTPGEPVIRNIGTGTPRTLREFVETCHQEFGGTNRLIFGARPYRTGEIMRYVPRI